MIQRPQTLYYMAMIAICVMLLFSDTVFYTATSGSSDSSYSVEYDETEIIGNDITTKESNTWLVYFIGAIGIIAFISLLTFKNRKLQVLLSGFNFLFILGFIVMMYMYTIHMKYFDDGESGFSFFVSLPLALILLNFVAIRRVKKDEQLIRSMDRLR